MKNERNHARHNVGLTLALIGLISVATLVPGTARNHDQERALRKVLQEKPSPPLREVERRLGYKNGSSLRKRFPQLSAAILRNHRAYRHRQVAELRLKLQSVLREDEPPSLSSAARRFNQERNLLRKYFPDVCREISERHAAFTRSQVAKTRAACEEEIRIHG